MMLHRPRVLLGALLATAAAVPLVGYGCGGKTATVDGDAASPSSSSTEAGTPPGPDASDASDGNDGDCSARGGVCLPKDASAPPNYRPAGPGEGTCGGTRVCWRLVEVPSTPCTIDPECNPSPTISAIYGACFGGVCVCNPGYHVQPNGKCDKTPPPPCASQGGKCYQQPATCPADHLEGSGASNMTCGDFVPAVCCTPAASCKGPTKLEGGTRVPVEFVCCAPNDALRPNVCVNGWRTCPEGSSPVAKPGGCG